MIVYLVYVYNLFYNLVYVASLFVFLKHSLYKTHMYKRSLYRMTNGHLKHSYILYW
jgi:hypothetical protein